MTRGCLVPRDARSRQRVGVMGRRKEGRLSLLLSSCPFPLALPWTALLSYEANRRLGTRRDSRFLPCLGGPSFNFTFWSLFDCKKSKWLCCGRTTTYGQTHDIHGQGFQKASTADETRRLLCSERSATFF